MLISLRAQTDEAVESAAVRQPLENFAAMPVKQLKTFLANKGLECKDCSEKADFVQMAFDSQQSPDVAQEPVKQEKSQKEKDEELDEVVIKAIKYYINLSALCF
jgi:hypothetical protein